MMVKVMAYAYATGTFSSRKIAKKLHEDVAYRVRAPAQSRVLAKELQSLLGDIVKALEADKQLPVTVELKATETVKNPFA